MGEKNIMLLSICIPSYNRGHRALELVRNLIAMKYSSEEIEIICSNNGSDKNIEGYKELKHLKNEKFRYHEFASNQNFVGNINQLIKMSEGEFCMLLSDEDSIVEENLEWYLYVLKNNPQLGIVKGRSDKMYYTLDEKYAKAGKEAIDAFYLRGNYVSGVIYNRKIITNKLVDAYAETYVDDVAYYYYPHMFYDTAALVQSDFYSSHIWLVEEGKPEQDAPIAENGPKTFLAYETYQKRLEQMHGFTNQIRDLEINVSLKFHLFLLNVEKTAYLIGLSEKKYIQNGYDWNLIVKEESQFMKKELEVLEFPISSEEIKIIHDYIDDVTVMAGRIALKK
jgi:glycosyltransferase involved in cell wall biosynthesis